MAKYRIYDFLKEDVLVSQGYGENVEYYRNISNGGLQHGHEGVDFKTPNGTAIYSPFDGIIVRDAISVKDYGTYDVIWDPIQCIGMWFCHLLDTPVNVNDHVKAGQLIAHTNNSGNTSGPHCHVNFVETDENGIRLNMMNGSEGFLNLMDPSLVEWMPCAAATIASDNVEIVTHYHPGDEIRINIAVPTGDSPSTRSFTYGKIDVNTPAKVLDIKTENGIVFYNVDQTYIGGGTGYALASEIDAHVIKTAEDQPAIIPPLEEVLPVTPIAVPVTSPIANIPVETLPITPEITGLPVSETDPEKKLDELRVQNNDLVGKLKEVSDKYKADLENYLGILALGYEKPNDIIKALEEVATENAGLKKQMLQILDRNKTYHVDMAAKEQEDATAIEVGLKFEKLYKDARDDMVAIAGAFKTKPTMPAILSVADRLRSAYDNVMRQLQKKDTKASVTAAISALQAAATDLPVKESGISFLERLITFNFHK